MDSTLISVLCILSLFILMMVGIPIVFSMGLIATVTAALLLGPNSLYKLGLAPFSTLFNLGWTPLPLFILMGTIIAESGMANNLYKTASNWLSRLRGGLVVAGIIGEAFIATCLGTSAAAIIVVGKVAIPEFDKQGYHRGFSIGALLAGGVLGPLIPPSATMIIYAVLTNVSLGKLFIAGIVPGIILALFLCTTAIILATVKTGYAPATFTVNWKDRFEFLKTIWPVVVVMICILGAIYFGIATPTETAGIGVVLVLIIGMLSFGMRWSGIKRAVVEAANINAIILFIIVSATFFTFVIGSTNVATHLNDFVTAKTLQPWIILLSINLILLFLGCIIDPITITLLTIPIFVPIIKSIGMDPIWFGVVFTVNTQIGLITPPMGTDLFAIKYVFNIPTNILLKGVMPFLFSELIFLALITAFPQLSLWLPNFMQ